MPVIRTSLTSYSPGPSRQKASSKLEGMIVLLSLDARPLALGRGESSGWLKVTMSPVIPRPVGPTID